jgi:hypothetical protein
MDTTVTPRATEAVFVTVTGNVLVVPIAVGRKVRKYCGEIVGGVGTIPVPLSWTVSGLSPALSVRVSVPVRGATAGGSNVTLMVQLAPTAREGRQLSDSVKFALA